jgi:hypothetical protein
VRTVLSMHVLVRVLFVLFCSGLCCMSLVFLIEKVIKGTELPASVGFGVAVLMISAYLLVDAVLNRNAVAFLVPPPLI